MKLSPHQETKTAIAKSRIPAGSQVDGGSGRHRKVLTTAQAGKQTKKW